MRGRYSDPVENLNTYVMVHGGIDRHDRLLDVEYVRDVMKAAKAIVAASDRHASTDLEDAISDLRGALNHDYRKPVEGDDIP